jgi:hypothetical protein
MTRPYRKSPLLEYARNVRRAEMAALYHQGKTLMEIGEIYGTTRQNIQQQLAKFGVRSKEGGGAVKKARRQEVALAKLDEKSMRRYGCTYTQFQELKQMRKPLRAYRRQQSGAAGRGISWELTFWQWWTIWKESGHWERRGLGQGYVMCRKGDEGPYAVGNVFIAPAIMNSSDQARKIHDLPIGVRQAGKGRFLAVRMIDGKKNFLGVHETPELAHAAYLSLGPIGV